jgi:hypothetical protein
VAQGVCGAVLPRSDVRAIRRGHNTEVMLLRFPTSQSRTHASTHLARPVQRISVRVKVERRHVAVDVRAVAAEARRQQGHRALRSVVEGAGVKAHEAAAWDGALGDARDALDEAVHQQRDEGAPDCQARHGWQGAGLDTVSQLRCSALERRGECCDKIARTCLVFDGVPAFFCSVVVVCT